MKILLLGKGGQVGWELNRTLAPLGEIIALDRQELDLQNTNLVRQTVRDVNPKLIVNAAAYTAVDKAEAEPEIAMAVNGFAPSVLAEEAGRIGAGIVHYSTDYVFDGAKPAPYTEEDTPNPLNVYGHTKLAGEHAIQASGTPHIIFRTSWVYGLRGKNFLLTILRLAREREKLKIVDDQVGSPTWSRMIAEATAQVLSKGLPDITAFLHQHSGIYNLTSSGQTTWYRFAANILKLDPDAASQICKQVLPIATAEYPTPAVRPKFSVLENQKLSQTFQISLQGWEEALTLSMTP